MSLATLLGEPKKDGQVLFLAKSRDRRNPGKNGMEAENVPIRSGGEARREESDSALSGIKKVGGP